MADAGVGGEDFHVETNDCRLCGEACSAGRDALKNPTFRNWIEKNMSIKLGVEGKSNFVCQICFDNVLVWTRYRSNFEIAQKKIEAMIKKENFTLTHREQRRFGVSPDEDNEQVEQKPELPVRIKIEPKLEADLFNTYGYTGINIVAPVQIKQEIKEEPMDVDSIKRDPDSEPAEIMLSPELIRRRIAAIKRKFKLIGLREKRKKERMMRAKNGKKCARPNLPTRHPRKAQKVLAKDPVTIDDDLDDPEVMDVGSGKKRPQAMPLSRKKRLLNNSVEEKKSTPASRKKRKISDIDPGKVTPGSKKSKTLLDFFPNNDFINDVSRTGLILDLNSL